MTCMKCIYGYTCSADDDGERTRPRDDCLDNDFKHYAHGDPILRKRELEFSGKTNIVLDGETEFNVKWDMTEAYKHFDYVCNEVGGLAYRGDERHSLIVETSYGPAFTLTWDETEKKIQSIIIKRSRDQDETMWIDFNYQGKEMEMDYR